MREAGITKLRNDMLDLCLASGLNMIECASAAYSVYDAMKDTLERETGGELVELPEAAASAK
jgi:hypothetical protein